MLVAAMVAAAITAIVFAAVRAKATSSLLTVAFRFGPGACTLPAAAERALGGGLTPGEIVTIETIARRELEAAYAGTRLVVLDRGEAFWHVDVLPAIRGRKALADAGHSVALGPLGGIGELNFAVLSLTAIRYAPPGAPRDVVVSGIGRGVGRAAVHELAHQIVATAAMDTLDDENSYEYASFGRASQYYGTLHWAGARPLVLAKIGR